MTPLEFNKKLDEQLLKISDAKFLLTSVTEVHSRQVKRIFEQGLNGNGAKIGNYNSSDPLYVNPDLPTQVNIEIASATKTGVLTSVDWGIFNGKQDALSNASASVTGKLTSTDWTIFNNKLSDGGAINDSLKFADGKAMYWGYTSPSVYKGRFYYGSGGSSLNLQTQDTHIYISAYGTAKNIEIISDDGDVLLSGNKYYLYKANTSENIEIDMSGFANGKVLTATSSTKAEWVTP